MFRGSHPVLIRIAAAFIALQALWSSMAATAYAAGFDDAKYLCATVALSAEARAQIAELVALTGLEESQDRRADFDPTECAACALGPAVALVSESPSPSLMLPVPAEPARMRVDQASPRTSTGPPVGLRAPPFHS